MGNSQSSELSENLSSYKLIIQIDNNSTELLSKSKNKMTNEEFVYFNLNKSIDYLLNKDISITYINNEKNYHNIFKFKIQLRESKNVIIHKQKYNELTYMSLPPIEVTDNMGPSSKLYCRYLNVSTNSVNFVVSSPVILN